MRIVVEPSFRVRHLDVAQQRNRGASRRCAADALMPLDRLHDLRADRLHGVECGHRVLEDERNLLAAHLLQLAIGEAGDVAPVQEHRAADHAPGRLDQAEDRQRQSRLARARLAHDAHAMPALDLERHFAHGLHDAVVRVVVRLEVAHLQDEVAHRATGMRTRGSMTP